MEGTFLSILNASITAGWLVLAVLVLRLVFKKAPKAISVLMWALVGIRLLLPFRFESALSLIPSAEPLPQEFLVSSTPHIQTGIPAFNHAVNPVLEEVLAPAPEDQFLNTPARNIAQIAAVIWLIGAALMLCYAAFSYLRIRRKVREAALMSGKVWLCDHIATPFILGVLRPRIYLPSSMDPKDMEYVIAHEKAHLKRKDHWWKPLGYGLLSIHWFNPLLWLAYILLCRDIELACDEAVLQKLGTDARKPYSEALLNCSLPRRTLAACPLAFGEVGVKTRIRSVLSYKKPALWIILAALLTCAALAVGFLTNPKTEISLWSEVFLRSAILTENRSEDFVGRTCRTDFEILGSKKQGRNTTYYLWVYYGEYTVEDGLLHEETGSHVPTVITLQDNSTVKEYWVPRDGAYYVRDIRRKFPLRLWDEALNSQHYTEKLKVSCEEQAWEVLRSSNREQTESQKLMELEKKYPQYFGLNTAKGLEVYVWQLSADRYLWGLMEGRNRVYTQTELMHLQGVSLNEMQTIVASYGLPHTDVSIHPIAMPHSSYYYPIDLAYQQKVEQLFWGDFPGMPEENFDIIIDTMTFDIDGDGKDEVCTIGPGPTSGVFSFTLTATEDGVPEYYNVFAGTFHHLSFEQMPGGAVELRGVTQGEIPEIHYFQIGIDNSGNITLDGTPHSFGYWGSQHKQADTETELTLAISAVIQNRYSPEAQGNICTQSYAILARTSGSGTPLSGQTEHQNTVTVCLAVQNAEYSLLADFPQEVSSRYIPTYLTFEVDNRGGYTLTEYCDDYREVMAKFQSLAVDQVSDHGKHISVLNENCHTLARELHHWQQGTVSEHYNSWKQRYNLAMEIKDFS